jgi:hypothetical protein
MPEAASHQLERPVEAAQKLVEAVSIAAHTVEEGKLHSEVSLVHFNQGVKRW